MSARPARIGYLNAHNHGASITKALGWGLDSLGVAEAERRHQLVARAKRYRLDYGRGAADKRRGARANVIATRHNLPALANGAVKISDRVHPVKLAPERWATFSAYRVAGLPIAHVQVHYNASPKALRGDNPDVPVVREYARGVWKTEELLDALAGLGLHVVLTGDVNLPDLPDKLRRPWSPHAMLEGAGFRFETRGVDLIAWSRRLALAEPLRWTDANPLDGHSAVRGAFTLGVKR